MARTPQFRQFIRILQQAQRENLKAEGKSPPLTKQRVSWTRRRLLKLVALASGSALATNALPHSEKAWSRDRQNPKIAIIGGGIAGLNAAYQLKKAGLTASVYEARQRLGGRVLSVTGVVGEGLVIDLGAHFINTDHVDILELVKEFGLSLFNRTEDAQRFPFPETGYYFNGRLRSEAEVATKLRPLARQISRDADLLDEDYEQFAPKFDRISVAKYLDKHADKISEQFIRVLVENTIRTEYGVEPDKSSALQLLFNLPTVDGNKVEILGNSDETFVVEGGSGRIIDSLAQALSGQIFSGMRLMQIESRGRGFHLTFSGNYEVDADYVIIAIPFTVLRDVKIRVDLPKQLRRFINEVDLGANEKLYAGFNKKVWRREKGFIKEAWTDLGFSAAWDETQRQVDRKNGALTFYFGGNEVTTLQSGSTKSQGKKFANQFENIIPSVKRVANERFLRTQWTQDPFTKGSYTSFKPGQLTDFADFFYIESDNPEERQDVNVGNLVFAGEHLSDEFYGYMNGAAQTGRLAAEVVLGMCLRAKKARFM
ncbi:Monoamine oxidase [Gloeocapsa sp. PCC 7428]|uniref:flavin monoamine oxidase family protein n=1 Tax=Gloeocapsa sp. PCC 7428 TaxID=1173026 RepID=UPI0002A5FE46|nr:NAD(P)/FAD-dependent oxidoreductase [Gloeocapsa sp. PCC 7428]AFZ33173.1 Monoamine oxidase [Gloeocapsa sp. PCC 7428]